MQRPRGLHHAAVFVEGEHHLLPGAQLGLDEIAQGDLGLDIVLEHRRAAQQRAEVVDGSGVVMV
jgi:hypothetical protein